MVADPGAPLLIRRHRLHEVDLDKALPQPGEEELAGVPIIAQVEQVGQ